MKREVSKKVDTSLSSQIVDVAKTLVLRRAAYLYLLTLLKIKASLPSASDCLKISPRLVTGLMR